MKSKLIFLTIVSLTYGNGVYHQEYNYRASSSSYRNNELQHSVDDEGNYSKHGDLEGRLQPKVNAHSQHAEYVNPKLQEPFYDGNLASGQHSSSFGQMHAQQRFQNDYQNRAYGSGGAAGIGSEAYGYNGAAAMSNNYGVRQVTQQVQMQMAQQLQDAIAEQRRRSMMSMGGSMDQAQIEADTRLLQEELRRNVTMNLEEALRTRYGNQAFRGGMAYSLINGRLQPTANYNNQELENFKRQMEADLLRQLEEGVRTTYHTTHVTSVRTQRNFHNGGSIHQQPYYNLPVVNNQALPIMEKPDYGPVIANPDSVTTIATRVQHDLNEHLNKILEDTQRRYFSVGSHQAQNWERILVDLQSELRSNISNMFDLQMRNTYGGRTDYRIQDLDNYKRQIENNLMTRLNRDFTSQKDRYFQTTSMTTTHGMNYVPYDNRPQYQNNDYVNNYIGSINQAEWANIQRQLQNDLSRQLQAALTQQQYRQHQSQHSTSYSGGNNQFNPQPNYQHTLQQLTAELNRNLTRQLEHSVSQYQGGSSNYDVEMARLRSQLQNDLSRQLQEGLQQTFSHQSSWSAHSSSSSRNAGVGNYRTVRGFDENMYGGGVPGEDCMMGDDPSGYAHAHSQEEDDSDLTQQVEDLKQELEDDQFLNQKIDASIASSKEKLTQKTESSEDHLTQTFEGFPNQLQDSSKRFEEMNHKPYLESHSQYTSKPSSNLHQEIDDLPQQSEDLTQQSEDLTQQSEDLTQQSQDLTQHLDDLTQQTEYPTHQTEVDDLNQNVESSSHFGQTSHSRHEINSQRVYTSPVYTSYMSHTFRRSQPKVHYYILDASGKRQEVSQDKFVNYVHTSPSTTHSRENIVKYYITDTSGHSAEISPDQSFDINTYLEKLKKTALTSQNQILQQQSSNTIPKSKQTFEIIDQDGNKRSVSETEFDLEVKKRLLPGQRRIYYKRSTFDSINGNKQIHILDYSNSQTGNIHSSTSHVTSTSTATGGHFVQNQIHFGQQTEHDQHQQVEFGQQVENITPHGQSQLNYLIRPGRYEQSETVHQQIDVSPNLNKPQRSQSQLILDKPQETDQLNVGQQIDDSDTLQHVQTNFDHIPKYHGYHGSQTTHHQLGQTIDETETLQHVQTGSNYIQRHRPRPGKLNVGQEIDETDTLHHVPKHTQQQLDVGQEIDETDTLQFGSGTNSHHKLPQTDDFGQQIETDSTGIPQYDTTNLNRRPPSASRIVDNGPDPNNRPYGTGRHHVVTSPLNQRPQHTIETFDQQSNNDLTQQQILEPNHNTPSVKPQKPNNLDFSQQSTDDLTQQVLEPDYSDFQTPTRPEGKPQRLSNLEFSQQTDDLTQQILEPNHKPSRLEAKPQRVSNHDFSQQSTDDLTQQILEPNHPLTRPGAKPQRLSNLDFSQQSTDDLTQQILEPLTGPANKPQRFNNLDFSQQTDDLTQQILEPNHKPSRLEAKPQRVSNHDFSQQSTDDLTQQILEPNHPLTRPGAKPQRLSNLDFSQQSTDDLTQQILEPLTGSTDKPQRLNNLDFSQQTDDLTQQILEPNYNEFQSSTVKPQRPNNLDFPEHSQNVIQTHQEPPHDFGTNQQEVEIIPPPRNSYNVGYRRPSSSNLQQPVNSQLNPEDHLIRHFAHGRRPTTHQDQDLTQQVQHPDFDWGTNDNIKPPQPSSHFEQPIEAQTTLHDVSPFEPQTLPAPSSQNLADADQTSRALIEALRKKIGANRQQQVEQMPNSYHPSGYRTSPTPSTQNYQRSYHGYYDRPLMSGYNRNPSTIGTTSSSSQSYQNSYGRAYVEANQNHLLANNNPHSSSSYHSNTVPQSHAGNEQGQQILDDDLDTATEIKPHSPYVGRQPQAELRRIPSSPYHSNPRQSAPPAVNTQLSSSPAFPDSHVESDGEIKGQVDVADVDEQEEITTTPAPGFWRRLGNKVKSKTESIRERLG